MNGHILTAITVVAFSGILAYKISLFREKNIGYFSMLQLIYLIIIPGLIFLMVFAYMQSIIERPLMPELMVPDSFIKNTTLLAILFTYGGIAIHSISKMLDEEMEEKESKAYKMNRYFHFTFSHNLIYSGGALMFMGLTLLDLNHVPAGGQQNLMTLIVKGVLLAGAFIMAINNYHPYASSRWSDLKTFFLVIWLGFMLILLTVRKFDPRISDYELLIPALLSFSLMSFLSLVVVLRKINRKWKMWISRKRVRKLLSLEESA